jgi:hypothetical protein
MNPSPNWKRIVTAVLIGCAFTAGVTVLQPITKADSIPDVLCEVLLLPGKLIAGPFHDRGTGSPEFLWRSRIANAAVLSGIVWLILRRVWNVRRP